MTVDIDIYIYYCSIIPTAPNKALDDLVHVKL